MRSYQLLLAIVSVVQAQGLKYGWGTTKDVSTYANADDVETQHIMLDLAVNFDGKYFEGSVTHTMLAMKDGLLSVYLDTVGIDIKKVNYKHMNSTCDCWTSINHQSGSPIPPLGDALQIYLPEIVNNNETFWLNIEYKTNDKSTAISWLTKEQTAGKKMPYLFSQCEDVACRSIAPLQDTPSVKAPYNASITVDTGFVVKMSGNDTGRTDNDTHSVFTFDNAIKMPSYLIAIAVGDLQYQSMGNRTGVITEPVMMDSVTTALSSLEELLDKTEAYVKTPYIWGNYTILVLPPSFPMGGMENPLLTFASPTIITEDKSQVYVATHEIAHSWTGNEVTCQNWSNMWLNEGFTVFIERKISGEIHGADFSKVNAYLGNISMVADMEGYGMDNSFSSLHPNVTGVLPDDSFSEVPYEKGFQLLYHIEQNLFNDTAQNTTHMQDLLSQWIKNHTQQSVVYTQFQAAFEAYVDANFNQSEAIVLKDNMNWDTWVKVPGIPKDALNFTTDKLVESQSIANEYVTLNGTSPAKAQDYKTWDSNLKVVFLEQLAQNNGTTLAILELVDKDLNITGTVDPECKQRWFPMGIMHNYTNVTEPAHEFISSQGRMKYLTPIYQALLDSNQKDVAIKWYNENIDFYHPYAVDMLAKLLGLKSTSQNGVEEPAQKETLRFLQY